MILYFWMILHSFFFFWIGSLHQQLLQGPVGIAIGIVFGFVYGLVVSKMLPSEKSVINLKSETKSNLCQLTTSTPFHFLTIFFLVYLTVMTQKYANGLRFMLMVLGGLLSVIGSRAIGFTSAGALGCMVLAVVCGRSWQKPKHIRNVMYNPSSRKREKEIYVFIFICTRDSFINVRSISFSL